MLFSSAVLQFYQSLDPDFDLPGQVEIMNPFQDEMAWKYTQAIYRKFYEDSRPRVCIFGINPGRFGGGITGIPFTDPIRLETDCGIPNEFRKLPELSSGFIYELVNAYGGAEKFYGDFFITALSPLGFTKNGKNLNYYDDKELLQNAEPFIKKCIVQQKQLSAYQSCICLGEGTNFKYFSKLNVANGYFDEITPVPHPRWVMQYRRKRMNEFVDLYLEKLSRVLMQVRSVQ